MSKPQKADRPRGAGPRRNSVRNADPKPVKGKASDTPRRPYPMTAVRIEQVQSVLGEILQWAYPADASLLHWLRAHPKLGARARGDLAYAVFVLTRKVVVSEKMVLVRVI